MKTFVQHPIRNHVFARLVLLPRDFVQAFIDLNRGEIGRILGKRFKQFKLGLISLVLRAPWKKGTNCKRSQIRSAVYGAILLVALLMWIPYRSKTRVHMLLTNWILQKTLDSFSTTKMRFRECARCPRWFSAVCFPSISDLLSLGFRKIGISRYLWGSRKKDEDKSMHFRIMSSVSVALGHRFFGREIRKWRDVLPNVCTRGSNFASRRLHTSPKKMFPCLKLSCHTRCLQTW